MYPGNIPGAPHNNKVRGICKPGLETQTPLYRSGDETRTLDEIALDGSREGGGGGRALTDSGPEREGDGVVVKVVRGGGGRMKGTRWTVCWAKIRGKSGGRKKEERKWMERGWINLCVGENEKLNVCGKGGEGWKERA